MKNKCMALCYIYSILVVNFLTIDNKYSFELTLNANETNEKTLSKHLPVVQP